MKHNELFRTKAAKLNESMHKTCGKKLNLEAFDVAKLEDARNKLRTQIHDAKSSSKFNEDLTDDTMQTAQAMLDVINAEILEREEAAIDANIMMLLTLGPNSNFMRHFLSFLL